MITLMRYKKIFPFYGRKGKPYYMKRYMFFKLNFFTIYFSIYKKTEDKQKYRIFFCHIQHFWHDFCMNILVCKKRKQKTFYFFFCQVRERMYMPIETQEKVMKKLRCLVGGNAKKTVFTLCTHEFKSNTVMVLQ